MDEVDRTRKPVMRNFTEKEKDLATRICALAILGPGLFIFLAQVWFVESSLRPGIGWIFLLLGSSFLSFDVTTYFINSIGTDKKRNISFETALGIIGAGLVFTSPSVMMSYYFGGIVVLSAIIVFAKIFLIKEQAVPNNNKSI